jgi:hypothetical protein
VLAGELGLSEHLVGESAFDFHHILEHLVVAATREENLASEEFV